MKWGDKYGPEYVNRLYNMVERNTTLPFKFICFTDNADGLLPEVSVRPLPDMPLPPDKERGWRKLSLFRDDVGLEGRVLFLDLDVVIVGNIDGFLQSTAILYLSGTGSPQSNRASGRRRFTASRPES